MHKCKTMSDIKSYKGILPNPTEMETFHYIELSSHESDINTFCFLFCNSLVMK